MIEPIEALGAPQQRGWLNVETRFAGTIAGMMDPAKVNPNSFRELVRSFAMAINGSEPNLQEARSTRKSLQRFTQTLALALSKGNVEKAKQLIGSEYDVFLDKALDEDNYVKRVSQMLNKMGLFSS